MFSSLKANRRSLLVFAGGALFGVAMTLLVGQLVSRGPSDTAVEDQAPLVGGAGSELASRPGLEPTGQSEAPGADETRFPYRIVGRVTDGSGRAVPGARVTIRDETGDAGAPLRALSDDDGRFDVGGVALGLYTVEANASGYAGAALTGVAPDGPALELRLHGEGAATGRALVDGRGRGDLTVLIGAPGVFPPLHHTTAADGGFPLDVWEGVETIELAVFGDEVGTGFLRRSAPAASERIEVALESAPPLGLAITGEGGASVEGGVVTVSRDEFHLLDVAVPIVDGRAEITGLPAGTYLVRVRSPGFLTHEQRLQHSDAAAVTEVALSPGATVSGVVIGPGGEPIEGAFVGAVVRDQNGRRWQLGGVGGERIARLSSPDGRTFWPPDASVRTATDGSFRLAGLPSGTAVLTVAHTGYEPLRSDSVAVANSQPVAGVELTLMPLGGEP